jgi:hypothetical protein
VPGNLNYESMALVVDGLIGMVERLCRQMAA